MKTGPREYYLRIDVYDPATIPMSRLAEYMADFANLLGNKEHVHFVRLGKGSCKVVSVIDDVATPKVDGRIKAVQTGEAPIDAINAYNSIDERLAQDNGIGSINQTGYGQLIRFPGRNRSREIYGPFNQHGTVEGIPIRIGGEQQTVPIHLQEGKTIHICSGSRQIASEISDNKYLFRKVIRANGIGRWFRDQNGKWIMKSFIIYGPLVPLDDSPLSAVVQRLRAIPEKWKEKDDPIAELQNLRSL